MLIASLIVASFSASLKISPVSANEFAMINAQPVDDGTNKLNFLLEDEVIASWPRECDNLCEGTPKCLSFSWSMENSKCQLYNLAPNSEFIQENATIFWVVKGFVTDRQNFKDVPILSSAEVKDVQDVTNN